MFDTRIKLLDDFIYTTLNCDRCISECIHPIYERYRIQSVFLITEFY